MKQLVSSIARQCNQYRLREKWLIAPSLRTGNQWVERVASAGTAVFNLRVKTVRGLALDIAGPAMAAGNLELASKLKTELLLARLWGGEPVQPGRSAPPAADRTDQAGYLRRIASDFSLARALRRTINAVRLAGLGPDQLHGAQLESEIKRDELAGILEAYINGLRERGLIDYPGVLGMAISTVQREGLQEDPLILVPDHYRFETEVLERRLLDAIEATQIVPLPADTPSTPPGDRTVQFFRAIGAANEVREIFRRCMKQNIPLDKVEILYTDAATYLPLIHEIAGSIFDEHHPQSGSYIVTFADGLPLSCTRPGRALGGWIEWRRQDYPQALMERLIHDGLLRPPDGVTSRFTPSELADALRNVPIHRGRGNYAPKITERTKALYARLDAAGDTEDGDVDPGRRSMLNDELGRLQAAERIVNSVLEHTPAGEVADGAEFLRAAGGFLKNSVHISGQLDSYALNQLLDAFDQVIELLSCETNGCPAPDLSRWAQSLPGELRVGGMGPRPCAVHAAHVLSGGHTGRPCTFIIGLDDTRFPPSAYQDPLLLDSERKKLSEALATTAGGAERVERTFAAMLAGLHGDLTLSYSARDIREDGELSPGPHFIAAYRAATGLHDAGMEDLTAPEVSFAPSSADECFNRADMLLNRFCVDTPAPDRSAAAAGFFPHLERGLKAVSRRDSAEFTACDGYVPAAGADNDPASAERVLSPSRLESYGRCPLSYFFENLLGLQLPGEFKYDPDRWLDPLQHGNLLHDVFRDFIAERIDSDVCPDAGNDDDIGLINGILESKLDARKKESPPPRRDLEESTRRAMLGACRIFLAAQQQFYSHGRPKFLEAAIGITSGPNASPLDTTGPVEMTLSSGRAVRLRGRIDRIDVLNEPGGRTFAVWDYKTGSAARYDSKKAFRGGRILQHALYMHMARRRLGEHMKVPVELQFFGYFFPGVKAEGEFIKYSPQQLADAKGVIDRLCRSLAGGAFPASETGESCTYCDFSGICGDPERVAENAKRKLDNPKNRVLIPLREVRDFD